MADSQSLGPLTLHCAGGRLCFTFSRSEEIDMELPANYAEQLNAALAKLAVAGQPVDVVVDFEGVPAISSRQLGAVVALHKALRSKLPRLPVTGVSEPVRAVFATTRVDRFVTLV